MVNGEPRSHIVPTRGLRLGDSLSPYLFLLCFEGLNGLIQHAINDGKLHGFSPCKSGPKISHLFFANDSLLFCRARMEEVNTIQSILKVYEKVSRQQINADKTTLFFGKAVSEETKNSIKVLLGVPKIKHMRSIWGCLQQRGKVEEQV